MSLTHGELWKHHLSWGVKLGLAEVACIQILTWIGLGLSHLTWILVYLLVILFAVLSGKTLARRMGSRPGVLRTFLSMVVIVLVSRAIYQIYMLLYITYADPGWIETVAEVWTEQLQSAGVAADQIESKLDRFRREWQPANALTVGLVSYGVPQWILGTVAQLLLVVQPWKRKG